ncbi:nucleotidase [Bacillus sp. FJAT-27231]|uniref:5' nucleotidase, NT5C type n=1 Tax=Bacillus sp. FJAT-27231 TaxID=1679168 RepID=UPI000670B3E3|nr:nucleotidase [Bacillus sp. FJAT-27231]KMY54770.1 nucleotidase [Bacillus sp. FJAT-27231]
MKAKRFGIDIDGTVTCPTSLIPFINQDFSLNITLDDIKKYDLSEALDIPAERFSDWFNKREPAIYASSPLAEGAKEVLLKWKEQFQLFFISARRNHLMDITERWFDEQDILYDRIELIGSHDKIKAAKQYKVDIFLEDKHDNAVSIHEELRIPVLLFNTPYNQDPIPDGVIRVDNWTQAEQWVNRWVHSTKAVSISENSY